MTTHITVSSHTINEGMMTLIFSFLLPEPLYIEIEILLNLLWEKKQKTKWYRQFIRLFLLGEK